MRILTDNPSDLDSLQVILTELNFKPGSPFRKHTQWVQPIYGQEAVERFLAIVQEIIK